MKGLFPFFALLLLAIPAQPVERIEPTLFICFTKEIVIHKEPQAASESAGHLLFGMPAVAAAKHNDWYGIYSPGGIKGWVQASDMILQKDFTAQYPHLTLNEAYVAALVKEASIAMAKKQSDTKLGELKFIRVKGESEEIYVRKDNVNIRTKPGPNARPVRKTFLGEAFVPAGMVRGFYKIEYDDGAFGWIAEEMVSPDTIEYAISMENAAGTPKDAAIYVMKTPDEKAPILTKARRDFQYEILTEKASWYEIRLDSLRSGWVPVKDFRITRPGLKNPTPSAQTPVIKPSNTGSATGLPPANVPEAAQPPVAATAPASVAAAPLPVAVQDTPIVKATEPAASPFARLDSLKKLINLEKVRQQDLEKQLAEARQDSLSVKSKIDALKKLKMAELDSLRLALNDRYTFLKDSLSIEREKLLTFQNSAETLIKLRKQKEAIPVEITKFRNDAKETRERAKNLKELAKFEFDVDTSAHAKDSLNQYARALDSTALAREKLLKSVDASIVTLMSVKPEEAAQGIAVIDSVEKTLPASQKNEFTALLQKQAALDQMLSLAKTQMLTDARERLKKLAVDLKTANSGIKKMEAETTVLEKELRKKR